jgi:hypothetical protein
MGEKRGPKVGSKKKIIPEECYEMIYDLANSNAPNSIREKFIDENDLTNTVNIYVLAIQKLINNPEDAYLAPKKDKKQKDIFKKFRDKSFNESVAAIRKYTKNNELLSYIFEKSIFQKNYKMAYDRFISIFKRSFERTLKEMFFQYYFLQNNFEFKYPNENLIGEDDAVSEETDKLFSDNKKIIKQNVYIPQEQDFDDPVEVSKRSEEELREFYRDMTKVRMFNKLYEYWVKKHLNSLDIEHKSRRINLFKKHAELKFNIMLNIKDFCEKFYKKDDHDRACIYCGISESKINLLNKHKLIETKRFYSRGKSIEVDQRDAYKGYSLDNIDLVCYWCNNSKTDEFTKEDFKEVGLAISKVWEKRLKKINE